MAVARAEPTGASLTAPPTVTATRRLACPGNEQLLMQSLLERAVEDLGAERGCVVRQGDAQPTLTAIQGMDVSRWESQGRQDPRFWNGDLEEIDAYLDYSASRGLVAKALESGEHFHGLTVYHAALVTPAGFAYSGLAAVLIVCITGGVLYLDRKLGVNGVPYTQEDLDKLVLLTSASGCQPEMAAES